MTEMSYPEVIKFKDSVVGSTVLGIFMGLLSIFGLWMYLNEGGNIVGLFILFIIAVILLIGCFKPTISTLSPDGVEVKSWGKTVFKKWSDVNDLKIYRQGGYLGVGRRFVTFQDETKRLQKHVFLVPINIYSKPTEVLDIVKSYRDAALEVDR
ncbi:MAG: hypothetical protein ABJN69_05140 [Hellea sp.]